MNECECIYHRYHVFHICHDHKEVFPHSQASCDAHRQCSNVVKDFRLINFIMVLITLVY